MQNNIARFGFSHGKSKPFTPILFFSCCIFWSSLKAEPGLKSFKIHTGLTFDHPDKAVLSKVVFEENKGQIRDQNFRPRPDILFSAKSGDLYFFLSRKGFSYQQWIAFPTTERKQNSLLSNPHEDSTPDPDMGQQAIIYRTDVEWIGIKAEPEIEALSPISGYNNYYNVPVGSKPALNVKSYESLVCRNVWDDVDIVFTGEKGYLEYDWVVRKPEAYKQIAFRVKGAKPQIQDNFLWLITPYGVLVEGRLKATQAGKEIPVFWKIEEDVIRLELTEYDEKLPIYIDPPIRLWSTYYGGFGSDSFLACAEDPNTHDIVAVGRSSSFNNIATSGAYQTAPFSTMAIPDAMVIKFNSDGQRLWGTYFGGDNNDYFTSCDIDAWGNIAASGSTFSTVNIATPSAYQTTFGGGIFSDGLIAKFAPNGTLLWATYLGGTGVEDSYACIFDEDGNLYVGGYSSAATPSSVIATPGTHQTTNNGLQDAYLMKFDPSGARLWGTYLGGNSNDRCLGICRDNQGFIYITGLTASSGVNYIGTPGTHAPNYIGGEDAFLVKFDSNGNRIWGTYFGGPQTEHSFFCSADQQGNIYIAGFTNSSTGNSIATAGAHQHQYGGGTRDAFLAKFTSSGLLAWGTYYGGEAEDMIYSVIPDYDDGVIVAGYTESLTGIATSNAFQTNLVALRDAFVARFHAQNGTLDYGTYYGGVSDESVIFLKMTANYEFLAVGYTGSPDVFGTPGTHQAAIGNSSGTHDGFLTKFCSGFQNYYLDLDGDGFGSPGNSVSACGPPPGYAETDTDCDDNNPAVNPSVAEICNYIDDNCNQLVDEGVLNTYYLDADGDGFGNPAKDTLDCTMPFGYSLSNSDCDDANASIYPGATEICNGIDDNCNNEIDEGCVSFYENLSMIPFEIYLSPSPFKDEFTLNVEINGFTEYGCVTVYNLGGSHLETKFLTPDSTILKLGSSWPSGFYIVHIQLGTFFKNFKIIKL